MAVDTRHATIGPMVTPVSYRNIDLTADIARTVDQLSGGRVVLGLGAGWFQRDYDEYGYEFGTPQTRLRALGEAIPRLNARLARLNPGPAGPLPLLIGGRGEQVTLRLVAKYARMWNCISLPPEEVQRLNGVIDRWCDREGTDPRAIERTALVGADVDVPAMLAAGITHFIVMVGPPYGLEVAERLLADR